MRNKKRFILSIIFPFILFSFIAASSIAQNNDEKPSVFKVILKQKGKEIVGILKMHFKHKFEAESDNGVFSMEFKKIKEIVPVEPLKKKVEVTLVSGEKITVKIINSLFLDKTVFGKFEIHLSKIKRIERKK